MVLPNTPEQMVPFNAGEPHCSCDYQTESFFSSADFVEAWSRSTGNVQRPLGIPVEGSGPQRTMYAIQESDLYWSRTIPVTRFDFCMSPGWKGQLERSTLEGILHSLTSPRTRAFVWFVRFDHEPLAHGLASLGLSFERSSTRVIPLADGYEKIFSRYNATLRNHVRKAQRRGVTIRHTTDPVDIHDYYQLYTQRAEQKEWETIYPVELSLELVKLSPISRFLVAECEGKVIGGALFVRDGCSVYLVHSALNHSYSHYFPVCGLYDDAIRWACESNAVFFNLGGSGANASLETSKAHWGARQVFNYRFEWMNPLWKRASTIKAAMRRSLNAFGHN